MKIPIYLDSLKPDAPLKTRLLRRLRNFLLCVLVISLGVAVGRGPVTRLQEANAAVRQAEAERDYLFDIVGQYYLTEKRTVSTYVLKDRATGLQYLYTYSYGNHTGIARYYETETIIGGAEHDKN